MASDGSFAISVGSDKKVLLFDIRVSKAVGSLDASGMSEMHEVSLSTNNRLESTIQNVSSMGGISTHKLDSQGFATVCHQDGSVSVWNLQMRQCISSTQLHSQ